MITARNLPLDGYKISADLSSFNLLNTLNKMNSLDGSALAAQKMPELRHKIHEFIQSHRRAPKLSVILVGHDSASEIYVQHKVKTCHDLGIDSSIIRLAHDTQTILLIETIHQLNQDPLVDGILLQLPLPAHIDQHAAIESIHPEKDVDGFTTTNLGKLASGFPELRPCTPWGIMQLLAHYQLSLTGKHAVILGSSRIVGRPLCLELLMAHATVTCCHHHSTQVESLIPSADLIISATGKRNLFDFSRVKSDAILIDVGIHRLSNNRIVGDIDPNVLSQHHGFLTPVPGGVGPMTVISLMQNTLLAATARADAALC